MADYILNGVIRAKDQTKAGTDSAKKNINGLSDAVEAAKKVMAALAVVQIVGLVAELTKLGAQADAVESRFLALAGSSQEAERTLRAIRTETDGTVDKMTAMASASKLMTLGLADSADSAAKLIGMATKLGDQTATTQQRIDDFGALLANQSIPRLDNFGISSAKVRERIRELQAEIPGLSREVAFNQAVMEQGAVAMERLGDASDNQAASLARAEAIWNDAKVALGSWVADVLVPAIDGAVALANEQQNLNDAFADSTDAAIAAGTGWEEYARKQLEAQNIAGRGLAVAREVAAAQQAEGQIIDRNSQVWSDYNFVVEEAIRLGVGYGETISKVDYDAIVAGNEAATQAYNDVGVGAANAAVRIDEYTIAQDKAADAAANAAIESDKAASALGEQTIAATVAAQIKILEQAEKDGAISATELADAQHALLTQSGLLTDAEISAQSAMTALTDSFIAGQIGAQTLATGVLTAKEALDDLDGTTVTIDIEYNIPPLPSISDGGAKRGSEEAAPVAFANGGMITTNAPALVGEQGPELIYGARGARVVDARRTMQITNNWAVSVSQGVGIDMLVRESRRERMFSVKI